MKKDSWKKGTIVTFWEKRNEIEKDSWMKVNELSISIIRKVYFEE